MYSETVWVSPAMPSKLLRCLSCVRRCLALSNNQLPVICIASIARKPANTAGPSIGLITVANTTAKPGSAQHKLADFPGIAGAGYLCGLSSLPAGGRPLGREPGLGHDSDQAAHSTE